jgi:hypothetical protein
MLEAIVTKRHWHEGAPDREGISRYESEIKAIYDGGSLTLDWDHALNDDDNYREAARELASQLKLDGHWVGACLTKFEDALGTTTTTAVVWVRMRPRHSGDNFTVEKEQHEKGHAERFPREA